MQGRVGADKKDNNNTGMEKKRYGGQSQCGSQFAGRGKEMVQASLSRETNRIINIRNNKWMARKLEYETHSPQQYLQKSNACIIQARNSISTLFEFMGKPMNSIKKNKVIEQLMKEHIDRAAKVRKEVKYWKLSQLMQYISKQATLRDEYKLNSDQLMKVSLTLIMVYTALRIAEVQMAELQIEKINQGEIVIATMTMKKPRGPVEKTLKAAQDRTVCPIRWIQSRLQKKKMKGELSKCQQKRELKVIIQFQQERHRFRKQKIRI
ncbi:MAG: hypothetical protein EZS28_038084 [Streblomastix strix]|uniref:Tyr recombinase domain-containing protein n=1 Tax=Streblomastix strix TaxID=222440 RepID=A0A5J4U7N2_9EUKA|nr:MAG: hypothetical protein EZS28_038084 [Streblomastix strix]